MYANVSLFSLFSSEQASQRAVHDPNRLLRCSLLHILAVVSRVRYFTSHTCPSSPTNPGNTTCPSNSTSHTNPPNFTKHIIATNPIHPTNLANPTIFQILLTLVIQLPLSTLLILQILPALLTTNPTYPSKSTNCTAAYISNTPMPTTPAYLLYPLVLQPLLPPLPLKPLLNSLILMNLLILLLLMTPTTL